MIEDNLGENAQLKRLEALVAARDPSACDAYIRALCRTRCFDLAKLNLIQHATLTQELWTQLCDHIRAWDTDTQNQAVDFLWSLRLQHIFLALDTPAYWVDDLLDNDAAGPWLRLVSDIDLTHRDHIEACIQRLTQTPELRHVSALSLPPSTQAQGMRLLTQAPWGDLILLRLLGHPFHNSYGDLTHAEREPFEHAIEQSACFVDWGGGYLSAYIDAYTVEQLEQLSTPQWLLAGANLLVNQDASVAVLFCVESSYPLRCVELLRAQLSPDRILSGIERLVAFLRSELVPDPWDHSQTHTIIRAVQALMDSGQCLVETLIATLQTHPHAALPILQMLADCAEYVSEDHLSIIFSAEVYDRALQDPHMLYGPLCALLKALKYPAPFARNTLQALDPLSDHTLDTCKPLKRSQDEGLERAMRLYEYIIPQLDLLDFSQQPALQDFLLKPLLIAEPTAWKLFEQHPNLFAQRLPDVFRLLRESSPVRWLQVAKLHPLLAQPSLPLDEPKHILTALIQAHDGIALFDDIHWLIDHLLPSEQDIQAMFLFAIRNAKTKQRTRLLDQALSLISSRPYLKHMFDAAFRALQEDMRPQTPRKRRLKAAWGVLDLCDKWLTLEPNRSAYGLLLPPLLEAARLLHSAAKPSQGPLLPALAKLLEKYPHLDKPIRDALFKA